MYQSFYVSRNKNCIINRVELTVHLHRGKVSAKVLMAHRPKLNDFARELNVNPC